jgi:hypothetical protein
MSGAERSGAGTIVGLMAGMVLLGIPLVAYLWESLNQLLAGHVNGRRLLVSLPLAAALAALLWTGGRRLERLATPPPERPDEPMVAGTLFLVALLLMVVFGGWLTGYALLLSR